MTKINNFSSTRPALFAGIANNVLLPDGSREPVMVCGNPATGQYRCRSNNNCWIYGDIITTKAGLEFQQAAQQPSTSDYPHNPLVKKLIADNEIKLTLVNSILAKELVSGLTNVTWTDGQSLCCMSYVEAGNFVASLRDQGECYSDLVLDSRPGFVTVAIWICWKSMVGTLSIQGKHPRIPTSWNTF